MINLHSTVCGFYKFEATDESTGEQRILADWFPNLITDNGLNLLATSGRYLGVCQVGTGSSAPSVSDTALANRIASNSSGASFTYGTTTSAPYYTWIRNVYRFNAGVATGNVSEVGVSPAGSTTGNLFSRALVVDSELNPTSITVLANETLDVTYELRYYAPTSNIVGTFTTDGTEFSWTSIAMNCDENTYLGWGIQDAGTGTFGYAVPETNTYSWSSGAGIRAYSGGIGSITSAPEGSSVMGSITNNAYIAESHYIDHVVSFGISVANYAGGIGAVAGRMGIGSYQIGFTPYIPKTADDVFSITIRHSWGRY